MFIGFPSISRENTIEHLYFSWGFSKYSPAIDFIDSILSPAFILVISDQIVPLSLQSLQKPQAILMGFPWFLTVFADILTAESLVLGQLHRGLGWLDESAPRCHCAQRRSTLGGRQESPALPGRQGSLVGRKVQGGAVGSAIGTMRHPRWNDLGVASL